MQSHMISRVTAGARSQHRRMLKTTWELIEVQMDALVLLPLPIYSSCERRKQTQKEEQSRIKSRRSRERKNRLTVCRLDNCHWLRLLEALGSVECGLLYLAEPECLCEPDHEPFVLTVRGGCSFEEKARRAQKPGFKAAIVYDNEEGGVLVSDWTLEIKP